MIKQPNLTFKGEERAQNHAYKDFAVLGTLLWFQRVKNYLFNIYRCWDTWSYQESPTFLLYSMGLRHLTCLGIAENAGKCPAKISELFHSSGTDLDQRPTILRSLPTSPILWDQDTYEDAINFYCCQTDLLKIKKRDLVSSKERTI